MTSPIRCVLLALLALDCGATAALADGYSRPAQRVIARARAASGGSGWDLLRGWHETGRDGANRYESWSDPLRYGLRIESQDSGGKRVTGFNGGGAWRILPTGTAPDLAGLPSVNQARTAAFFRVNGYLYPGRIDARGDYVGVRQSGGRSFEVVNVRPWGGTPRELWFDRRTHLLARTVDRSAGRPVTTEISDYRKVGPVLVAFRYAVEGAGPGGERQLESLDFLPADRAIFSLPRP